jgi:site-specific recombinase XerD
MKTVKNTLAINFYLHKGRVNKDGKSQIVARITLNSKRLQISTGKAIEESRWNSLKGVAKGTNHEVARLNRFLSNFHSKILEAYERLNAQNKLMSIQDLKFIIEGKFEGNWTVTKLIEYHNESQGEFLEWGTMKNYMTTQKYLMAFIKDNYGYDDYNLVDLSYKFLTDFNLFLRRHKNKKGELTMANNGVMKHLERLCKMVNLGVKLEWIDKYPFAAHQAKFDKVERSFLTPEELQRIELKRYSISRLNLVRDLFLFSCYTGLSYIDVVNLKSTDLAVGVDGLVWIMSRRKKTSIAVKVPLLPVASRIIERYQNTPEAEITGKLFPTISNQKLNSYLKEIADLSGINKTITFHTARHTFATTVTLSNGVPIETVSRLLGHSKISTTQIYARVVEKKISEDMSALKKALYAQNMDSGAQEIPEDDCEANELEREEVETHYPETQSAKRKARRRDATIIKFTYDHQ